MYLSTEIARNIYLNNSRGFSLIELMIVISIIGILASLALPAYQDSAKRTYVAEGLGLATMAKSAIQEYWLINGSLPMEISHTAFPSGVKGKSVKSITISSGKIIITYNEKVTEDKTIIIQASFASNKSLVWDCTGGTLADKLKPLACR